MNPETSRVASIAARIKNRRLLAERTEAVATTASVDKYNIPVRVIL
jgi:hypothetical protein